MLWTSEIWVWGEFRADILYCTAPQDREIVCDLNPCGGELIEIYWHIHAFSTNWNPIMKTENTTWNIIYVIRHFEINDILPTQHERMNPQKGNINWGPFY